MRISMINMKWFNVVSLSVLIIWITISGSGCGSSGSEEDNTNENRESKVTLEETSAAKILSVAKEEQSNEMYSPSVDSTYLYWLNNRLIVLTGSTKCNIFLLNVLYKSGFKTPTENALARDLFDTLLFTDIFPIVGVNDISNARKGDIIAWYSHVILFESLFQNGNNLYAIAWWAGTRQADNGENIRNNVCYGKYKLSGDYVVRRPQKKIN